MKVTIKYRHTVNIHSDNPCAAFTEDIEGCPTEIGKTWLEAKVELIERIKGMKFPIPKPEEVDI